MDDADAGGAAGIMRPVVSFRSFDDVLVRADLACAECVQEAENGIQTLHGVEVRRHDPWWIEEACIEVRPDERAVLVGWKRRHARVIAAPRIALEEVLLNV